MDDRDLRALVRETVERRLGRANLRGEVTGSLDLRAHPSHLRLPVASGVESDGPCLIEPSVACAHCGYCQSYGH